MYVKNGWSSKQYGLAVNINLKSINNQINWFTSSPNRLPTDIQSDAIPMILGGGDVLMAAETGSGKTGAFCLPEAAFRDASRDSMYTRVLRFATAR